MMASINVLADKVESFDARSSSLEPQVPNFVTKENETTS